MGRGLHSVMKVRAAPDSKNCNSITYLYETDLDTPGEPLDLSPVIDHRHLSSRCYLQPKTCHRCKAASEHWLWAQSGKLAPPTLLLDYCFDCSVLRALQSRRYCFPWKFRFWYSRGQCQGSGYEAAFFRDLWGIKSDEAATVVVARFGKRIGSFGKQPAKESRHSDNNKQPKSNEVCFVCANAWSLALFSQAKYTVFLDENYVAQRLPAFERSPINIAALLSVMAQNLERWLSIFR